jgi:hypothetical protein
LRRFFRQSRRTLAWPRGPGFSGQNKRETVSKRCSLVKIKADENLALALHFVQPQEYIEYFEDSAKASLRAKLESNAEIGQTGAF